MLIVVLVNSVISSSWSLVSDDMTMHSLLFRDGKTRECLNKRVDLCVLL